MRLLLDTHTFLWFVAGSPELSSPARGLIEDPANTREVSIASVWEMAIKTSLGKLEVGQPFDVFIREQIEPYGFTLLPIAADHAVRVASLPFPPTGHRDPFDRLLIAQALCESIPIVGADATFDVYGVTRLW